MKKFLSFTLALFLVSSNFVAFAGGPSENVIKDYGPTYNGLEKYYDITESDLYSGMYNLKYMENENGISFSGTKTDGKTTKYINVKNISGSNVFEESEDLISQKEEKESLKIYNKTNLTLEKINSTKNKQFDKILYTSLSGDKNNYFSIAKKDGKYFIIQDGKETKKYDYITDYYPFYDGNNYFAIAVKDGKKILIKNGVELYNYNNISNFIISPDNKSFAFIANSREDGTFSSFNNDDISSFNFKNTFNEPFIVKNGIEIDKDKKYDRIDEIKYSDDSKNLYYLANNGEKYILVKDGIKVKEYNGDYNYRGISIDNNGIIIKGTKNGNQVLVNQNGLESNEYNGIDKNLYFQNGKDLLFTAWKNGKMIVVRNGVESKGYDGYIQDIIISNDNKSFSFTVQKDLIEGDNNPKIYVVQYKIKKDKIKDLETISKINSSIEIIVKKYKNIPTFKNKLIEKLKSEITKYSISSQKDEILKELLYRLEN